MDRKPGRDDREKEKGHGEFRERSSPTMRFHLLQVRHQRNRRQGKPHKEKHVGPELLGAGRASVYKQADEFHDQDRYACPEDERLSHEPTEVRGSHPRILLLGGVG